MIVTTVLIVFFVWLLVLSSKTHALRQTTIYSFAAIIELTKSVTKDPVRISELNDLGKQLEKLMK